MNEKEDDDDEIMVALIMMTILCSKGLNIYLILNRS